MPRGNIKNLKPFVKGKSGNPNGRPAGTFGPKRRYKMILETLDLPISALLAPAEYQMIKQLFPGLKREITVDELLAAKIARLGILGDGDISIKAHKHLREEGFGKLLEGSFDDDENQNDPSQIIQINIDKKFVSTILKSDKIE